MLAVPGKKRWTVSVGARAACMTLGAAVLATLALQGNRRHSAPLRHLPLQRVVLAIPTAAVTSAASVGVPVPSPTRASRFAETLDVSTFQKGNIHTHSTHSDGDAAPQDVYAWYRDHGYNFLALTDHNVLTDPAIYRLLERKRRFVMIAGEEVTMRGAGKQVHVNALCTRQTIGGKLFDTQREALAWAVRQIQAQGGVALVNHPNWDWALTAEDLPSARGASLLEIWSGHPYVHTLGDETHLSHEAIWNVELGAGETFAAVAVDDAHIYGARAPDLAARPGRGWVQVFAQELTRNAICAALAKGRLYASTGVTLKRIAVSEDSYAVWPSDVASTVEFVGTQGVALQTGLPGKDGAARYALKGGETFVRARITARDGKHAWTQPSFVER